MTTSAAPRHPSRDDPSTVRSVLVALDLLDCFADRDELGVTEIARRLGVAKSTAHRLLTTLCSRGMAEQIPETGLYRLGLHLYELGQLAQDRAPLRQAAFPLLEELRLTTGHTVSLSIVHGPDVVFVERLRTLRGVTVLGDRQRRLPLHVTSAGKVLAAFDPEISRARMAAGFPRLTDRTIGSPAEWLRALGTVRRCGYAVSDGENQEGFASVAAPVRDVTRRGRAAISVTGPSAPIMGSVDRLARVVMLTAAKVGHRLGW